MDIPYHYCWGCGEIIEVGEVCYSVHLQKLVSKAGKSMTTEAYEILDLNTGKPRIAGMMFHHECFESIAGPEYSFNVPSTKPI